MFDSKKNKKLSSSSLDSMPITTVLGADVVFTGNIEGDSIIRIDGKIAGNVSLKQGVILGEKASVTGDILSEIIVIYGTITGNITCKELIIRKSGTVNGDIKTEIVEIEMGGQYNGKLSMTKAVAVAENTLS